MPALNSVFDATAITNADWEALPDLHALVEALAAEFAALESVAERRRSAA
jgi:hypothetical protein